MIDRYTRPKMKAIWELKRKYEIWLAVELAACAAFERAGQVPRGTSARIGKKATIDVKRTAPSASGIDGLRSVQLTDAMGKSAWEGVHVRLAA